MSRNWREKLDKIAASSKEEYDEDLTGRELRRDKLLQEAGLFRLAKGWQTCYVGEQRERLEQRGFRFANAGIPLDPALRLLGEQFNEHVATGSFTGDFSPALEVADQIDFLTVSDSPEERRGQRSHMQMPPPQGAGVLR